MSFLIDENLSWRLLRLIEESFPGCRHAAECGLSRADDASIWTFAKANGLSLLSKDDDLRDLVVVRGTPPKLVWLRLGNVSTLEIAAAIQANADTLKSFLAGNDSILEVR